MIARRFQPTIPPFDEEHPVGELGELVARGAGLGELLDRFVQGTQRLFVVAVLVYFHLFSIYFDARHHHE